MRVFLAGATGVLGIRLVPLLVERGDVVAGMTRWTEKADPLRALGAEPVICDVFDAADLRARVVEFGAEAVVDELTDLPDDPSRIPLFADRNNRIRREGTANLLAAARAAGAERFVVQSVAWELPGEGATTIEEMERAVLDFGGVVVRYGQLYGPGTYFEREPPPEPRIQVEEAARRTLPALEAPPGTVLTIVE